MKAYFKLLRVHHYLKNLLVMAALVFSGQLQDTSKLLSGLLGFTAFCFVTSIVYIINDICDRDKDAQHPTKRNRPIASGAVSVPKASCIVLLLFFATVALNLFVMKSSPVSLALLGLYLIINLAYSFGLKNVPLVDLTILVAGFLIRILYGASITGIAVSNWLYLTVLAFAFFFALGKRRNELCRVNHEKTRKVLAYYNSSFLDKNMYMCLGMANVFYALWALDVGSSESLQNNRLIFTVPLTLLISMKYSLNIEGDSDGDPIEVVLHDKGLIVLCLLYFCVMLAILYL